MGYKGTIGRRLGLAADIYRTRIEDFYGDAVQANPNVYLNPADLQAYLEEVGGLPAAELFPVVMHQPFLDGIDSPRSPRIPQNGSSNVGKLYTFNIRSL